MDSPSGSPSYALPDRVNSACFRPSFLNLNRQNGAFTHAAQLSFFRLPYHFAGFKSCLNCSAKITCDAVSKRLVVERLVRVTGLEPARLGHQNLNLARLPIPPYPHIVLLLYDIRRHLSSAEAKKTFPFAPPHPNVSQNTKSAENPRVSRRFSHLYFHLIGCPRIPSLRKLGCLITRATSGITIPCGHSSGYLQWA